MSSQLVEQTEFPSAIASSATPLSESPPPQPSNTTESLSEIASSATSLSESSSMPSTPSSAGSTETSIGSTTVGLGQTNDTHKAPVGAIAGGVVGGLVLAIIVYLLLKARRRKANEVEPFPQNDNGEAGTLSEKRPVPPIRVELERPEPFILSEKQQAPEMVTTRRHLATTKSAHLLAQSSSSQNLSSVIVPPRLSDATPRATTPLASSSSSPGPESVVNEEATQPPNAQAQSQDPSVIEQLLALRHQVHALESRVQLSTSSSWSPSDSLPPPEYTSNT